MRIDVVTIFPEMVTGPLRLSIIGRAIDKGLVDVRAHQLRDWTTDRHRTVDDAPFGGGSGMVMKAEPIFAAVEAILGGEAAPVVLLSATGRTFTQAIAAELATLPRLVLICGHYEGIDERVRDHLATDEISIGDYVLTGGEIAALVIVDAVARLLPGVIAEGSLAEESHSSGLLEYPHYTRPATFRGWSVPDVLLSGNHAAIARWRQKQARRRTAERRPDLLTGPESTSDTT